MLTGQTFNTLQHEQISFIQERRGCGKDEECISSNTTRRIAHIQSLIDAENDKITILEDENLTEINGTWKSLEDTETSFCGPFDGRPYYDSIEFDIRYPSVRQTLITKKGLIQQRECVILKVRADTFAKVYSNFKKMYENVNYFGKCGGDVTLIPYSGRYILLELSDACGALVLTGQNSQLSKLIYDDEVDLEDLIDDMLITSGYVMGKIK